MCQYCGTVLGWNTNPYLHVSFFAAPVVILTLSEKCFKQSGLSPETSLVFNLGLVTSLTKNQHKPSKPPNDKPNSLKHVRHSVPKLE